LLVLQVFGSSFDQHSVHLVFETFVSVWDTLLTPAEFYEFLFVILVKVL
jgi:hypothetical protein